MRVAELWRYPVKSLQGERLAGVDVGPEGLSGDRQWALFDVDSGLGLTARRVPDLLFASGRLRADGGVDVVLPDGTVTADDAVLSRWLGRPVELAVDRSWPWLQVYSGDTLASGQRRRSLAVEPMTCPPNALADGTDLVVLAPDGTWSGTWTLGWTPA